MIRNPKYKFIEWKLIITYLIILAIGLITLSSVDNAEFNKQTIFSFISLFFGFFILILDGKFLISLAYSIYSISMILLVFVLLIGVEKFGAKSWFNFGAFSFQPSELAKFGTLLAIGKYLSGYNVSLFNKNKHKHLLIITMIIMCPIVLIMIQPDAGSALIFCCFIIPLFREGLSKWIPLFIIYLFSITISVIIYGPIITLLIIIPIIIFISFLFNHIKNYIKHLLILIFTGIILTTSINYVYNNLATHQKDRIDMVFGKLSTSYNVQQSLIAIGNGGWFGEGYGNGTQTNGAFVPKQSTDFIFSAIAEQFGFTGCLFLLLMFFILIKQILVVSERQKSIFSRVYGYGVGAILFIHLFINISMSIGIFPVVGIPLPFISYGGSSLISMTILLFFLIKLDSYRMEVLR
tara:strand:- start:718 stop:1938 length:1221 start_codon:yes stop_codon:yes gene_type:complete